VIDLILSIVVTGLRRGPVSIQRRSDVLISHLAYLSGLYYPRGLGVETPLHSVIGFDVDGFVSVIIRRLIARLWGWSGISSVDDIFHLPYFRLWHLADMETVWENICFRTQSRH
jgi:hypothetical protein